MRYNISIFACFERIFEMKKFIKPTALVIALILICIGGISCSGKKTDANGLVFTIDKSTNTYSVAGYVGTSPDVTIPESFESLPVSSIAAGAFKENKNIKSVTIPESVRSIGATAFIGCTELNKVVFAGTFSINSLATGTFSGCTKLDGVVIPDSVKSIGYKAFENCTSMTTLTLPSNLETIDNYAFSGCTALKNVIFDRSQSFTINANAFYKCDSLTTLMTPEVVTDEDAKAVYTYKDGILTNGKTLVRWLRDDNVCKIGAEIEEIADGAFYECFKIERFEVDAANKSFFGDTFGVLYSGDKTKMIAFPAGKDLGDDGVFEIPTEYGVREIAGKAFCGTTNVKKIILPETVAKIGEAAFGGCLNLQSIVTGTDKIEVGANAFVGCATIESYKNLPKDEKTVISGRVVFSSDESELIAYPTELDDAEYTVPKHVSKVRAGAFAFNSALDAIKVEAGSVSLAAENGVLYGLNENGDKVLLCAYPRAKSDAEYKMPVTVTAVNGYAFYGNENLTKVTLAKSCEVLSEYMFKDCKNLGELIILANELKFETNAVAGCSSLEKVKFGGNKTAWNKAISDASGVGNQAILKNITLENEDYNYEE